MDRMCEKLIKMDEDIRQSHYTHLAKPPTETLAKNGKELNRQKVDIGEANPLY